MSGFSISINDQGLVKMRQRLSRSARIAPLAVKKRNEEFTLKLRDSVREHASGPPGPSVRTGKYVSSIVVIDDRVVSLEERAARLEFGFVGEDRLGRMYNDPPRPHFRPALAEIGRQYVRTYSQFVKKEIL